MVATLESRDNLTEGQLIVMVEEKAHSTIVCSPDNHIMGSAYNRGVMVRIGVMVYDKICNQQTTSETAVI